MHTAETYTIIGGGGHELGWRTDLTVIGAVGYVEVRPEVSSSYPRCGYGVDTVRIRGGSLVSRSLTYSSVNSNRSLSRPVARGTRTGAVGVTPRRSRDCLDRDEQAELLWFASCCHTVVRAKGTVCTMPAWYGPKSGAFEEPHTALSNIYDGN
jgi:hypothetical protein